MEVEGFVKTGERLLSCDVASGFSQPDEPFWPK